jgi:hypothetical protein
MPCVISAILHPILHAFAIAAAFNCIHSRLSVIETPLCSACDVVLGVTVVKEASHLDAESGLAPVSSLSVVPAHIVLH